MRKNLTSFIFLLPLLLLIFAVTPSGAGVYVQCPAPVLATGALDPVTNTWISTDGQTVCIHLVATDGFINMADKATTDPPNGRLQYTFGFTNVTGLPGWTTDAILDTAALGAEFSAPTISIKQGQDVYLTLTNRSFVIRPDLFDSHSVHFHGFPNAASIFDGEPMASTAPNPGIQLHVLLQGAGTRYLHVPLPCGSERAHADGHARQSLRKASPGRRSTHRVSAGFGKSYTKFAYNDGDGSTGYDVVFPIQITAFDPDFHDADQNIQPLPFANMTDSYTLLNGRGYPDTINPAVLS